MVDIEYSEYLARLNRDFPAVTFRAGDEGAYAKAQEFLARQFQAHHQQARQVAALLDAPVPEAPTSGSTTPWTPTSRSLRRRPT